MPSRSRTVVSKIARTSRRPTRSGGGGPRRRLLDLMMICCEEEAPYGPAERTASLLIDLLCDAYRRRVDGAGTPGATAAIDGGGAEGAGGELAMRITVYHAQRMDYPATVEEWDGYDGVILPGSFSSAYDTRVAWIGRLMEAIQRDIHAKRRKAIGICFGHQAFAHSFGFREGGGARPGDAGNDRSTGSAATGANGRRPVEGGGRATECAAGPMAGRRSFRLTREGRALLLGKSPPPRIDGAEPPRAGDRLDLLYTRGDMVTSVPPEGVSLLRGAGGDLPHEACAYFASAEERDEFCGGGRRLDPDRGPAETLGRSGPMPYAITFQAHPEFASRVGHDGAFANCCRAMAEIGSISDETRRRAIADADLNLDSLLVDSLEAMASACSILGWFQD